MPQAQIIQAVFDQLPAPALIYDGSANIVAANRAAVRLLETESAELAGRPCSEVFHCRACSRGCELIAGLRGRGYSGEHTLRITTSAGREHLAFVRASQLIDERGRLGGVLAIFNRVVEKSSRPPVAIIAEAPVMCQLLDLARRVASSEASTVLLQGESGTGKEVIARLLHEGGPRSREPFVAINCAAMPESLLESELFGYEKGAFTDARAQKKGLFELASQGTLFLDEIGELPIQLQAKLLRVLDDHSFRRVGGLRDIQFDLRIVAATNRDLPLAVAQGRFRLDLFYRVNVIQLTIPPLRERREDILPLARYFLDVLSLKYRRNAPEPSADTARLLLAFDWPGNVRELKNVMERSLLLEESAVLSPDSLPACMRASGSPISAPSPAPLPWFSLKESEQALIAAALVQTQGNQSGAARLLGISRDALRFRLKKRKAANVVSINAAATQGANK